MRTSHEVRERYGTAYYLGDCGGHREYALFEGRKLEDPRLAAVHALAAPSAGACVLDVGCGRGELAFAFAAHGAQVTAIDYSADALALARATAGDLPVRFLCADVTAFVDPGGFNVAVASDVIEHLAAPELDELYEHLAAMLSPDGCFVLHTWPNAWMYRYGYPRQRREAARRDERWPEDPRSSYEQAMHINEQRPNVLRRQLRRWFPHALVWLGTAADPRGSLAAPLGIAGMRDATDVFAVAAHRPIDAAAILARITTPALMALDEFVQLSDAAAPPLVRAGEEFAASVVLRNDSGFTLSSFFPHPIRFADRWHAEDGTEIGRAGRSLIAPAAGGGTTSRYLVRALAPAQPGRYVLRFSLVQEFVRWFESTVDVRIAVE
jgi:2-polyprenyl-3-methyl-5-hydroxy-6-metoxy-1,4-benzoquinol methylase